MPCASSDQSQFLPLHHLGNGMLLPRGASRPQAGLHFRGGKGLGQLGPPSGAKQLTWEGMNMIGDGLYICMMKQYNRHVKSTLEVQAGSREQPLPLKSLPS